MKARSIGEGPGGCANTCASGTSEQSPAANLIARLLADDTLGVREILRVWQRRTDRPPWLMPLPHFVPRMMPKDFSTMLACFGSHGFTADVAAVGREHHGMQDLTAWVAAQEQLQTAGQPK